MVLQRCLHNPAFVCPFHKFTLYLFQDPSNLKNSVVSPEDMVSESDWVRAWCPSYRRLAHSSAPVRLSFVAKTAELALWTVLSKPADAQSLTAV